MKLSPLTPEEERVIIHKETEPPFQGEYDDLAKERKYYVQIVGHI